MNVELKVVKAWPSRSLIADVADITKVVEAAKDELGVKVAVRPSDEKEIVPAIGCCVLVGATVRVEAVTVKASIRLLNCN